MSLLLAWALGGALTGAGVELEWTAPLGCPERAEVRADLDRFLGGRPGADALVARVDIVGAGDEGGFVATVRVAGFAARTLRGGDCRVLARAAALVIAVAVDPLALAARVDDLANEPGDAPSPLPEPAAAGEPPIPVEGPSAASPVEPPPAPRGGPPPPSGRGITAADPRARSVVTHAIGVRGGALYGAAGRIAGAVALVYDLDRGPLRFEARAVYGAPRRVDYPDGVGVDVQSLAIGALACLAPERRWLRVPICGGVEAGPAFGLGIGAAEVRRRASAWASALVGVGLVARVHPRVAVTLAGELGVALRRPAFHVGDRAVLVRAPPVGGRVLLGLEFRVR